MRVHKALTRTGSAIEAAKDFGLVAILPALLPFLSFHVAVRFLPLWGQVVVSLILFAVLLAALWSIR